jgi:hypothetical protein
MTWKLIHDSETVGEWSDDIVDKIVQDLTNRKKSSLSKFKDPSLKEISSIVLEFLPDPIREVISI